LIHIVTREGLNPHYLMTMMPSKGAMRVHISWWISSGVSSTMYFSGPRNFALGV
jgi:hypothetical protein